MTQTSATMAPQVTFQVRASTIPGEVIAICGSCDSLGNWKPQNAVALLPVGNDGMLWRTTIPTTSGARVQYRYFKGSFLESKNMCALEMMDSLESTEDLSEPIVQGDPLPGHVGTACLLSSTIVESGKSSSVLTLPIMSRNSRKTIGKVRVDFIVINPIKNYSCDMNSSFSKYWKPRTPLDVGHRGAGNSTTTAKLAKVRENTIASLKNAASHGAAFVEFDVHLSKDCVPVIYHDLTCLLSMKKKHDAESIELFEIPVKDLSYNQLQLLKLSHVAALKLEAPHASVPDEESSINDNQPFPSLQMALESVPEDVGFNIEIKWICQQRDGVWDGNLSTYFDMNLFLDTILKTVLENAGRRRILFSSFDADICTMVRVKQNRYPILFLTQGQSDIYPELMDLRSRTTHIAMSFARFEDILGINVHTEDLLRNPSYIEEAKSKGLVIFCWGDDTNDPENRKLMRQYGIDGLIYDRIYDWNPEQPNVFQIEHQERLKRELPEGMLRSCLCPPSHFPCTPSFCMRNNASILTTDTNNIHAEINGVNAIPIETGSLNSTSMEINGVNSEEA
ncbi:glycerophosphocholine phosphodiesterase GPCPD1 isoform X2 [Ambystoma mexicanum]|uniref:glycerophosphocholine phosphodiesterase GPCPD1 isoform X2 n=1 Tax=Ambystoma mexicanum TaxID=8296 RepID=UPI0037E79543